MKLTQAQQEIFDTYTKNNPDLSYDEVSGFLNWLRHKNLDDEVLESCEQSWMEDDNMGDYWLEEKLKKYIRTQMKLDSGEIVCARICVATGEIKPHKYPVAKPITKARKLPDGETNGLSEGPPWTRIPAPCATDRIKINRKVRSSKENTNKVFLEDFMFLSDAVEEYPVLDDLFVGATSLGNSERDPQNKGVLFSMLRDLDELNVLTVQGYTGYHEGHCYKLAQTLRIISNALDKEIDS